MVTFRKSLVFSFAQSYAGLIIQFVSTMVLARLLVPEEIGIFSVAVGYIGLAQILREFGVARYVIQEEELTTDRLKAAFTITLLVGWFSALIIFIAAPYLGRFYGNEGIKKILDLLSINFFLVPFGAITFAYLRRSMQFGKLMVIQITSALAHSGVAIYCAYIGLSYMSLGWAAIAGTATSVLLTFVVRPKAIPYLPGIKEIKRVLSYGTYASMSSVIEHVNNVAPDWIMGRTLGMQAVGLYSRAQGTIGIFDKLITSGIRSVVEPYFAQVKRDNQNLKEPYLHMVACVTVISWSFFGYLYIMALPVFRVLYGDNWDAAIPLLQIWCVAHAIYSLTMFAEQVFSVIGKIKQLAKVQFLMLVVKLVVIGYVSVSFGLIEVIQTFYGLSVLRFLIIIPMVRRYVGVTLLDHFSLIFKGGLVSLLCLVVTFGCNQVLSENLDHLMLIVVSGGAWFVMFLMSLFLVKHPLAKEFINIANKIARTNRNPVL